MYAKHHFKKYLSLKRGYPIAVFFFRYNDSFRIFYEDAEVMKKIFGGEITIDEDDIPTYYIQVDEAEKYVDLLLENTYPIVVCHDPEEMKARRTSKVSSMGEAKFYKRINGGAEEIKAYLDYLDTIKQRKIGEHRYLRRIK